MKVWIDGKEYTGDMIVVKLDAQDKKNIAGMPTYCEHYAMYNEDIEMDVAKVMINRAAEDLA